MLISFKPPMLGCDRVPRVLKDAARERDWLELSDRELEGRDRRALLWLLAQDPSWKLAHGRLPFDSLKLLSARFESPAWVVVVREPQVWIEAEYARLDPAQRVQWLDWIEAEQWQPLIRWHRPLCRFLDRHRAEPAAARAALETGEGWLGSECDEDLAAWLDRRIPGLVDQEERGTSSAPEPTKLDECERRALARLVEDDLALLSQARRQRAKEVAP